jgi:hypothetical protein
MKGAKVQPAPKVDGLYKTSNLVKAAKLRSWCPLKNFCY